MNKRDLTIAIGVGILIGIAICYFVSAISDFIIKINMVD